MDPPAAAVAQDATPPDTVVRRVVRLVRRPSAIQRVTQDVHVRRALQPIDSALVVRVYDQRGVEIGGVPVQWTLVGGGARAQLRVGNARTDSLGLSRAAFVPGASADTQHVYASVAGVGRIDFGILVRAQVVRVRLARTDVWSGDDVIATAELRDAGGRELSGGYVSWGSTDTTVVRVRAADAWHGRITAVGAGEASVVAWPTSGTVQGAARVRVRPVISGAFVTLDGSPPPLVRAEIVSNDVHEPLELVGGRFTTRVRLDPDAAVELRAQPVSPEDQMRFSAVDVRIHAQRDLEHLRVALVPTSWRIDSGTYSGRVVPIDAGLAMRRTSRGAAFWRLVPISGTGPRRLLGWRESDLPLRLAFDRGRSRAVVTADDSIAFWNAARRMERDLGMRLFVPAEMRPPTAIADSQDRNLVGIEVGDAGGEGETFVSWGRAGDAGDGVLLFRRSATLRDPHVVTHELVHLLGFGHTSEWSSVSQPSGGREPALTVSDVAYIQLAMRLRRFQRDTGARPGLPVAAP